MRSTATGLGCERNKRKNDREQFSRALNEGTSVADTPLVRVRRVRVDDCPVLREWSDSPAPVLFDFSDGQGLVWLLPSRSNGFAYAAGILRGAFVHIHRTGVSQPGPDFGELVEGLRGLVANLEAQLHTHAFLDPLNPRHSPRGRGRRPF